MGRSVAVVLVHYHTPELAAEAVAAVEADAAAAGLEVEGLVVDNGSDEAGRRRLEELPFRRLAPGRNLGFAGGVNLGAAESRSPFLVLMNPDVLVLPGCLAALVEALAGGAAVAGPRFFWDRERRMQLPPAERRGRLDEALAALAQRGGRWAALARRRWRRHARRHWRADKPLPSAALSGSLLAIRRDAWEIVGPFDDAYPLYFEETDWLLRVRHRGLPTLFVPAAEAVHLHAQSAVAEPRAQGWFEESARRFRTRHYGSRFTAALDRWGRPSPDLPAALAALPEVPAAGLSVAASGPRWIEVSPNPTGFPAAAERLAGGAPAPWRLPAEIAARLPAGTWRVALCDDRGRERAAYRLASGTREG